VRTFFDRKGTGARSESFDLLSSTDAVELHWTLKRTHGSSRFSLPNLVCWSPIGTTLLSYRQA